MLLSVDSRKKFEDFLRENSAEVVVVPKVKIYSGKIAGFLTKTLKTDGITFGRRVFVRPNFVWRDENSRLCCSIYLLPHEMAHVLQYQKYGRLKFLYFYLRDFWRALRTKKKWDFQARHEAYLEIPFEVEARKFSEDYLSWRANFKAK